MAQNKCVIISDKKLLGCSEEYLLYYGKGQLYFEKINENKLYTLGEIPLKPVDRLFNKCRLTERIFRLEPRCALALNNDNFLVSCRGGIYKVSIKEKKIVLEHEFRTGMNNTLNFCKIEGIKGFKDCIVYGEYFSNTESDEVNIVARYEDGVWKRVFTFAKGEITHIHNIIVHLERDSLIVLTGDENHESIICEIRNDFCEKEYWVSGQQKYRACVAFPCGNGILYATDTPLEDNAIYYLEIGKNKNLIHEKVFEIAGPCIYGTKIQERFVFATSVEPDSRIKNWRYLFTYKLGYGVKERKSHIYVGGCRTGFDDMFCAKKDIFPMGLFQFGNFQFPTGLKNDLYVTGQSLHRFDGKTVKIEHEL